MRFIGWGACFIFLYLVILIVIAPASLLSYACSRLSNNKVLLIAPEGSLWNGRGKLVTTTTQGVLDIGPIEWKWQPSALKNGAVAWQIILPQQEGSPQPMIFSMTTKGILAKPINAQIPAALIGVLNPAWQALDFQGTLQLSNGEVQSPYTNKGPVSLLGKVTWNDAAVSFIAVRPLGTWVADVTGDTNKLTATLSAPKGPLFLDGTLSYTSGQLIQTNLFARIDPDFRERLLVALSSMLSPIGNDRYRVDFAILTETNGGAK